MVSLYFSVTYSFRPYHGSGVDSARSENEYQEHLRGVKAAVAWGWQPHHLHVTNVMEIWEPKPSGTLWATPGLLRDWFTFTFTLNTTGGPVPRSDFVCNGQISDSRTRHWSQLVTDNELYKPPLTLFYIWNPIPPHFQKKNTVDVSPFPNTGEAERALNLILFGFHCHSDIDIRTLQAYGCLYARCGCHRLTGVETCAQDRQQNTVLRHPFCAVT